MVSHGKMFVSGEGESLNRIRCRGTFPHLNRARGNGTRRGPVTGCYLIRQGFKEKDGGGAGGGHCLEKVENHN